MTKFSADCSEVNPSWKIEIESSQLPVIDGREISYKCPKKHAKKNTNMKAVCQDGHFFISPGGPLPCAKIGKCTVKNYCDNSNREIHCSYFVFNQLAQLIRNYFPISLYFL